MKVGATFSHFELNSMGLDWREAWQAYLGFGFEVVRLGVCWDEVEAERGVFELGVLTEMLRDCEDRGLEVIVTVGMKAPRWPEYHLPKWLKVSDPEEASGEVLVFIARVVEELKGFDCIVAWQVENEPLDPSGPERWRIPLSMLKREVALVRQLDEERLVYVTGWANGWQWGNFIKPLAELSDEVGIDVYYRYPVAKRWFVRPAGWEWRLRQLVEGSPRPVFVAELQGEAWEKDDADKWQAAPRSMNPEQLRASWERAARLGVDMVLWWGFEYWWWRKKRGWDDLWLAAQQLVRQAAD